jgi:integrase
VNRFGERKEIYDKNLANLKLKLNKAIYEDAHFKPQEVKMSLAQWYHKWIEFHKYQVIRESTKVGYDSVFHKHIEPTLGKMQIKDITQLDIKELLKKLDKQGFGYETRNRVRIMLLDMFDKALIDDFVKKNPVKGIKIKRDEKSDIRVFSREEQAEFFECCKGTFYDNLYVVAVCTGLRIGELTALTWDDIDLKKKLINVDKTLLYQKLEGDSKKEFHIHPPKTKTSKRKVPINKQCELALKKQYMQRNVVMSKQSAKPLKGFENLLFTSKFGTPLCDQIVIDSIERVVNEINLCKDELEQFEMFSPHCFRHTFATRCFEADIPPKTVQKYLGHATLQMTMDLYTTVLENKKQEDMLKLEGVLDEVFECGDLITEEKYQKLKEQENNDRCKVISIKNVG